LFKKQTNKGLNLHSVSTYISIARHFTYLTFRIIYNMAAECEVNKRQTVTTTTVLICAFILFLLQALIHCDK